MEQSAKTNLNCYGVNCPLNHMGYIYSGLSIDKNWPFSKIDRFDIEQ